MNVEPLLRGPMRRVTFPIPQERIPIWNAYKTQISNMWTAEEFKFSHDLDDWHNKLNDNERYFISYILAFFAESDALVNANLLENFLEETQWLEVNYVYCFQAAMENIHSETYSLKIETYIQDERERDKLRNAIQNFECISFKKQYADKYADRENASFAIRLIAFAIFEGIFFSGSFCAIYWLKDRGLMQELCNANEVISRDEGEHTKFACLLFKYIENKPEEEVVHNMFKEAVEIEQNFITEAIPCKMIGMNDNNMKQYIEFIADGLLLELGYSTIYNSKCPFQFIERIGAGAIDSFFDKFATTYSKSIQSDNPYETLEDF